MLCKNGLTEFNKSKLHRQFCFCFHVYVNCLLVLCIYSISFNHTSFSIISPTLAQELSLRAWRIIVSHIMLISGIQSLSFDWGDKEIWREYPDLLRSIP